MLKTHRMIESCDESKPLTIPDLVQHMKDDEVVPLCSKCGLRNTFPDSVLHKRFTIETLDAYTSLGPIYCGHHLKVCLILSDLLKLEPLEEALSTDLIDMTELIRRGRDFINRLYLVRRLDYKKGWKSPELYAPGKNERLQLLFQTKRVWRTICIFMELFSQRLITRFVRKLITDEDRKSLSETYHGFVLLGDIVAHRHRNEYNTKLEPLKCLYICDRFCDSVEHNCYMFADDFIAQTLSFERYMNKNI